MRSPLFPCPEAREGCRKGSPFADMVRFGGFIIRSPFVFIAFICSSKAAGIIKPYKGTRKP